MTPLVLTPRIFKKYTHTEEGKSTGHFKHWHSSNECVREQFKDSLPGSLLTTVFTAFILGTSGVRGLKRNALIIH